MKKVLVTGGTGFIGAQLIKQLLREGNEILALYRDANRISMQAPGLEWVQGDLEQIEKLIPVLHQVGRVVHAAAYAKPWAKDPKVFSKINTEGTIALAKAAQNAGIQRFVFVSTAGVFGPTPTKQWTTETDVRQTAYYTLYEASKAEAEKQLRQIENLDWVIVNPTRVYGPGLLGESNAVTKIADQYRKGKFRFLPGDGSSMGNYVFVDDVVEGILGALKMGHRHQNYLLGGENASYIQLFAKMEHLTGQHQKLWPLPLPVMLAAAQVMEGWANISGQPPLITPPFVKKYAFNWSVSHEKANTDFGYRPSGLLSGLSRTFDWLNTTS